MKLTKKLLTVFFIGSAFLFTGCLTDTDEDSVTINLTTPSTQNIDATSGAKTLTLVGDVEGSVNLTSVDVTISPSGAGVTSSAATVDGTDEYDLAGITIMIAAGTATGEYTVTISATAGSATSSKTITLNVTGGMAGTDFDRTLTGAFFHIAGACRGSYDLEGNTDVSNGAGNPISDMVNTDAAGAPFTGSWTTGTGNSTTYVKANSYDYAGATVESATAAHSAGSASGTVNNPANNDIYIADLSAGGYAVIQITNVTPGTAQCDNGTATGNTGKITFSYKIN